MSPGMSSRRTIGGVEIVPGARFTHDPSRTLRFSILVVCVAVDPDSWVGEVRLGSMVVLQTGAYTQFEQAARAAENTLMERVIKALQT